MTLSQLLVYLKDKSHSLSDRKRYFYKHITLTMFEELKCPSRKQDLYFIANLIGETEPIQKQNMEPLSPVPYTLGNGVSTMYDTDQTTRDENISHIHEDTINSTIHEDTPTSIIHEDIPTSIIHEDTPTSIIHEDTINTIHEDTPTSIIHEDTINSTIPELIDSPTTTVTTIPFEIIENHMTNPDKIVESEYETKIESDTKPVPDIHTQTTYCMIQ